MEHLNVFIDFGNGREQIGEMHLKHQKIYFKYSNSFLEKGFNISPIKLKWTNEIQSAPINPFYGLFGVFSDSLSDGWGALLLDRSLAKIGIQVNSLNPLQKLAYTNINNLGALYYEPTLSSKIEKIFKINLDTIANKNKKILSGQVESTIDQLYQMGGSSLGARPKIHILYNLLTNDLSNSSTDKLAGYEHWIIKFPAQLDAPDIANIEYAYYLMATDAGIKMSSCKLFPDEKGKVYFGTKRFDRSGNTKLHLHSAAGLMHDDFRKSNMDYGHLMDAARQVVKSEEALCDIFRLATFNVLAQNRDDHSKNFSYLMDQNGEWQFAPAYDLTYSSSGYGWHSTSIAGESAQPTVAHLMQLAIYFNIANATQIIEEVESSIQKWTYFADKAGVSKLSKQQIAKALL